MSIPDLLHAAVAEDASRPFMTFYDESTGERVELSVATTANWVAKTANMLQDSLAADGTTTVRVDLPLHWEACVWLLSCWSVGCAVTFDPAAAADVAVVGPEATEDDTAADTVALSLRPLGARFADPLPAGVLDYNAEVLGHGDHFTPFDPPSGAETALYRGTVTVTQDQFITEQRERVAERARILLVGDDIPQDQAAAVTAALAAGGSLVLVRTPSTPGLSEQRRATLVDTEQVSADLTR